MFSFNNKTTKKIGHSLTELFKNHPVGVLFLLILPLTIYLFFLFGFYALKNPPPKIEPTGNKIKAEVYQKVLAQLKSREAMIQQTEGVNCPDIFK